MRPLVATNIEQAFRLLNADIPEFEPEFLALAATDPSYERPFALHGSLTVRPVLYNGSCGVTCAQRRYVGFYAIQQAVRGILLGINHVVAGGLLLNEGLHSPAIASYYTAAYHGLHAFLALEGRVLFDSAIWPIPLASPAENRRPPYIALLNRHNCWLFESRPRNHRRHWLEVEHAFASELDNMPKFFHDLFGYMYQAVYKPGVNILDVIADPRRHRVRLRDRAREFLIRIAETRHQSIYASCGDDTSVIEALWNGDTFSICGIDAQSRHFGEFAASLLMSVSTDVYDLTTRVSPNAMLRTALDISVHLPWFDAPQIDNISIPFFRETAKAIAMWLAKDSTNAELTELASS